MTFELRDYQADAVRQTYEYFTDGRGDAPIIVAPTGAGKSLILAQIIKDATAWGLRVMLLTHVKELLEQNAATLLKMLPDADFGFYSAGIGQKAVNKPITFAGIQSVYRHADKFIPFPEIIIIDEAHLVPENTATRYGRFLEEARLCNPDVKIIGLTATPYRLGSGLLYEGENAIFSGVSYDIPVRLLMERGYLCRLVSRGSENHIDLTNVGRRGGEFIESQLAMAASDPDLVRATADEIARLGVGRKSWLVFCSGVQHAEMMADAIREASGERVEIITGETPKDERKALLAAYKRGDIRCLCNVNVLTTGFDAPQTDLVALVRATASTSLYVQMVGRGTRIAEGKENCLVLDYGQNVERHGLFDAVNPSRQGSSDGGGEAPVKECPNCEAYVYAGCRVCDDCGHEFPEPELNHGSRAHDGAITSDQVRDEWVEVDSVSYERWKKRDNPENKPDTLRITYHCGLISVSEWLCPDHEGYARRSFEGRKPLLQASADTLAECLDECGGWQSPFRIKVRPSGRFHDIVQFDYSRPGPLAYDPLREQISAGADAWDDIPF